VCAINTIRLVPFGGTNLIALKRKLRLYLKKLSLDLEEEKKQGYNWDAENNIRTSFGQRELLHRLAESRVNWTKLMHILKNIGIDWRERRLISKL
jgi:hypothetical protein